MTEVQIQRAVLDALHSLGITCWRNQAGTARNGRTHLAPAGTPDIIGYLPGGRMLAIEVKAAKGKPSEEQLNWLRHAESQGVICGIARSAQDAINIAQWGINIPDQIT